MKNRLKKLFNKDNIFKIEMVVCITLGGTIMALDLPIGLAIVWISMGVGGLVLDEIAEERAEERQKISQIGKVNNVKLPAWKELNPKVASFEENKALAPKDSNVVSPKDSIEKKAEEILELFIANNDKINATAAVALMDAITKVLIDGIPDDLIDYYYAKLNEFEQLFYDTKEEINDLNRKKFIGGTDE